MAELIYLPIPVEVTDTWIPEYFQDVDVNILTLDDVRKFLTFHVEQYKLLSQKELRVMVQLNLVVEEQNVILIFILNINLLLTRKLKMNILQNTRK